MQHSSVTNEHGTPKIYVEAARRFLGVIDLDPASSAAFNRTVRAKQFYTEKHDGLRLPWNGRVFNNPPGGKVRRDPETGFWVPVPRNAEGKQNGPGDSSMLVWWGKAVDEWLARRMKRGVFVAFQQEILRTSQDKSIAAMPVQRFMRCYPSERICFTGDQPSHANLIVGIADRNDSVAYEQFVQAFRFFGECE